MREHSGEFLCLRWVWADEGIDPYKFFQGFRKNRGIVTGGNPRRGAVSKRQSAQIEELSLRTSGAPRSELK